MLGALNPPSFLRFLQSSKKRERTGFLSGLRRFLDQLDFAGQVNTRPLSAGQRALDVLRALQKNGAEQGGGTRDTPRIDFLRLDRIYIVRQIGKCCEPFTRLGKVPF